MDFPCLVAGETIKTEVQKGLLKYDLWQNFLPYPLLLYTLMQMKGNSSHLFCFTCLTRDTFCPQAKDVN